MSVKTTVQVLIGDILAHCTVEVVAEVKAPVPQAVNDFCAKARFPSFLSETFANVLSFILQIAAAVIKASSPTTDNPAEAVAGVLPFARLEQSQSQRREPSAPSAFARDSAYGTGALSDAGMRFDQYPKRGRHDSIEPGEIWPESKKTKLNNGMAYGLPPAMNGRTGAQRKARRRGKVRTKVPASQNPNKVDVQPDKQWSRGYDGGTYAPAHQRPPPLSQGDRVWQRGREDSVPEDTSNRLTPPPPDWFVSALSKSYGLCPPPGLKFDPDFDVGPAGPMPPELLGLKRKTAPADNSRPQSAAALPSSRVGLEPARADVPYRAHDEPHEPAAEGSSDYFGPPPPPRNEWLKAASADLTVPLPRLAPPQASFSDPVVMPARANVKGLDQPLPDRPTSGQLYPPNEKALPASDQQSDIWAHRNASLGPSSPEDVV